MNFGLVIVEVCDANAMSRHELFALEEAYPGVSVLENTCMSECDLCARRSYVFVNDKILSGPDPIALLEKIKVEISNLLANYEMDN